MKTILAIDGGGIRGVLPASLLTTLEQHTGQDIASMFDLIVGTSTGAIIATMLSRNIGTGEPAYTAGSIRRLYIDHGNKIFQKKAQKSLSSFFGLADEKYSSDGLKDILNTYMGNCTLGDSIVPTMVTAYDITNREAGIFKSWDSRHKALPVTDCVLASTAAPTYFEPTLVGTGAETSSFVDGGVYANNPSLIGLAEAKVLWPDEKEFTVISLGTGWVEEPYLHEKAKNWGLAEWVRPLISMMFDGQTHTADYITKQLSTHYYRADNELHFCSEAMDDVGDKNMANLQFESESYCYAHLDNVLLTLKHAGVLK
jgi:patatin-like phospholipase/acyl hydrolase